MPRRSQSGITMIEMLIVMAILSLIAAISFPSVSAGLDSVRISSASDETAAFLNSALNRCERKQIPVEIVFDKRNNALIQRSVEPGFEKRLSLPPDVRIERLLPELPFDESVRSIVLYPGGAIPRIGMILVNGRGARRSIRIDPMTGAPEVERL